MEDNQSNNIEIGTRNWQQSQQFKLERGIILGLGVVMITKYMIIPGVNSICKLSADWSKNRKIKKERTKEKD